jgi:phage-related protein
MTVFNPSVAPSWGSNKKTTHRALVNEFGDGYVQTVGDGLNNKKVIWTLIWNNLNYTELTELQDFFDAIERETFTWTDIDGVTRNYMVSADGYDVNYSEYNGYNLNVVFEESFVL